MLYHQTVNIIHISFIQFGKTADCPFRAAKLLKTSVFYADDFAVLYYLF